MRLRRVVKDPPFPSNCSWCLYPFVAGLGDGVTTEMFYSLAVPASISGETTTEVAASVNSLQGAVIQHRSSLETASLNESPKSQTEDCPGLPAHLPADAVSASTQPG